MSRRRLLSGFVAVALLGVAGFALLTWLMKPTPGVTWENFRRLRSGMSARDVTALLGERHGVYNQIAWWRSEEVVIELIFMVDKLTSGKAFPARQDYIAGTGEKHVRRDESFLDLIRGPLHW